MRHPCLDTVFELPSHGAQSQLQFLFKIEVLQGFHLSRGSSDMNIIKIGDIKIFAGTPGPASTLCVEGILEQDRNLKRVGGTV